MQTKKNSVKINLSFPNTHPSSSRSVSMRDIVVGKHSAPLYPAFAARRVGVTNGARGFTLIELLVVVLIVGILASIALPQYQKAVTKSRYASMKHVVQSIYEAEKIYYLANGQYTQDFNELDIEVGQITPDNPKYTLISSWDYYCVLEGPDFYAFCKNNKIKL